MAFSFAPMYRESGTIGFFVLGVCLACLLRNRRAPQPATPAVPRHRRQPTVQREITHTSHSRVWHGGFLWGVGGAGPRCRQQGAAAGIHLGFGGWGLPEVPSKEALGFLFSGVRTGMASRVGFAAGRQRANRLSAVRC